MKDVILDLLAVTHPYEGYALVITGCVLLYGSYRATLGFFDLLLYLGDLRVRRFIKANNSTDEGDSQ